MNNIKTLNYILGLKDKNVFLTGSTGYFGSYLSIEMAKCGANIILNGRSKEKLIKLNNKIKKLRLKSQIAHFDINDHANLKSNVKKFKKIDVLIHNAYDSSINYSDKNLKKNNYNANQSFMLNFFSVINLNKVFLSKMIKKKNSLHRLLILVLFMEVKVQIFQFTKKINIIIQNSMELAKLL